MSEAAPSRRRRTGGEKNGEALDFLQWWRTKLRRTIPKVAFRNKLVQATRGVASDPLLNSTLLYTEDGSRAAFTIACQLANSRADSDLIFSWVAYAGLRNIGEANAIIFEALSDRAAEEAVRERKAAAADLMRIASHWLTSDSSAFRLTNLLHEANRSSFLSSIRAVSSGMAASKPVPDWQRPDRGGSAGVLGRRPIQEATRSILRDEAADIPRQYRRLQQQFRLAGAHVDPDKLASALLIEFPWMGSVIEAIVLELRLLRRVGVPWVRLRPFLLVGPPGCGKTRFARRVGQMTGIGSHLISVGGSSDNRMLQGTARGWSSAEPSFPLQVILRAGIANPLLIVDEIDKAVLDSRNGSVANTLLSMLEPETATRWLDECLVTECDISQISWLLTANTTRELPEPLLSRLRIEHVRGPEPEHFDSVLESILRDAAAELDVAPTLLPPLEPEVIAWLRSAFTTTADVRRLRRAVATALAYAAKRGSRVLH